MADAQVSQLAYEIVRTLTAVPVQVSQVVREILWTDKPPSQEQPQIQVVA